MTGLHDKVLYVPVFSLNFSSAGKGPFMAGKAKNNYAPEVQFAWGGRDQASEGRGPSLAGKFRS